MTDPASLATLGVLTKIGAPAVYTDANLVALVACRAVNLSLERGNCDASCSAYVWVSMVAGPRFGDYRTAVYRFGQLGYDLVEGRGLTRFQARTYMELDMAFCPGPDMSGLAAIWCAARSRRQTRWATSPTLPTCGSPAARRFVFSWSPQ